MFWWGGCTIILKVSWYFQSHFVLGNIFSEKKKGAASLTTFHAQLILSMSCWRKIKMLCNLTSDLRGLSFLVVQGQDILPVTFCIVEWRIWVRRTDRCPLLVHVSWYLSAYECAILYIITCNSLWCNTSSLGTPGPWQAHHCTSDTACYFQLSGVTSGAEYQNSRILTSGGEEKLLCNGLYSAQQPQVTAVGTI